MRSLLLGNSTTEPSTSAVSYVNLHGSAAWSTTEDKQGVVPSAGTLRNFRFSVATAPGSGNNWVATVRVTEADSVLTLTIADTATTGVDLNNSVTVSAGNRVGISLTPTSTPDASGATKWSCEFISNTSGESIWLSGTAEDSLSTTSTEYVPPNGVFGAGPDTTENLRTMVISAPGTIKNLYCDLATAPGAGTSRTFTLMLNGVAQSLTATISNTATTANDTSNSVAVVAGDVVSLRSTLSGSVAASKFRFGLTFVATTDGYFNVMGNNTSSSTTADNYTRLQGTVAAWATVETVVTSLAPFVTFSKLYISQNVAPGAGKSYAYTLRLNAASTALTATVSEAGTTANDTTNSSSSGAAFDGFAILSDPAGTPTAQTRLRWALTGTITSGSGMFNVF